MKMDNEALRFGCADCGAKACHTGSGNYPPFCPGGDFPEDVLKDAMKEYEDPKIRRITIAAAETESENYCKMTRMEETVEFAKKIGAKKIGLCVGHDSLFYKYAEAPVTTLVSKDRVLAHNTVAALYQADKYLKLL